MVSEGNERCGGELCGSDVLVCCLVCVVVGGTWLGLVS